MHTEKCNQILEVLRIDLNTDSIDTNVGIVSDRY